MAALIYVFIVKRRRILSLSSESKKDDDFNENRHFDYNDGTATTKTNPGRKQQSDYTLPITSYILGWGCIVPISFYLPYMMLYHLRILNGSVRMSTGTTAIIVAYRCIEAMYHTSPHTVEYNIYTYMTYYSSLLHFQWNPTTHQRRSITMRELISNICYFVLTWALLSIVFSYLMFYDFQPFESPIQDVQNFHINSDMFHLGHIGNMYLLAILTYLTLSFGLEITGIGEQVKGHYTEPIFYNPLFSSRSPSDFWNRRCVTFMPFRY
jgi:hypothetical protein